MFWCLVRLSTGALCGGLYANPLEMTVQSAVTCSEAKDDGLLVSWQLMECVLVWVVSASLAVEDGFLLVMDKSFDFSVGQMVTKAYSCKQELEKLAIFNIRAALNHEILECLKEKRNPLGVTVLYSVSLEAVHQGEIYANNEFHKTNNSTETC